MPKYALVNNGSVLKIVRAPLSFATNISSKWQYVVDLTGVVPAPEVGDFYSGSTFTKPTDDRPYLVAKRYLIQKLISLGFTRDEIEILVS